MINDEIKKPVGKLSWVLFDEKTGRIKAEGFTMNQVQDAHKIALATQCDSTPAYSTGGLYQYMDGSPAAKPAASATELTTPFLTFGSRQAITTSTSSTNVVTVVATFAAAVATGTWVSAGMYLSNSAAGLMCCGDLSCVKGAGDALTITWAVTFN